MLEGEIMEVKKFILALRSVKKDKMSWDEGKLIQAENDFRIKLTEVDKKSLLSIDLMKELKEKKFHNSVVESISKIYQFEERRVKEKEEKRTKRNSDDGSNARKVPTKESAEFLNASAELIGLLMVAFRISTSQIRRYLDSLRKVKVTSSPKTFSPSDVLLQQVKVAYASGRNRDLDFFYEVMKPAINEGSKGYEYFEQLLRFVEAIIAYHRFYRGED